MHFSSSLQNDTKDIKYIGKICVIMQQRKNMLNISDKSVFFKLIILKNLKKLLFPT